MIEGRKGIKKTMGVVFTTIGLRHVIDDRLAIFNHMPIAINDHLTLERHRRILLHAMRVIKRSGFVKIAPGPLGEALL
jgi:hypothetical protein